MVVKGEVSGWRDEALSRWHRTIGYDCPAQDIDCLMVEYDHFLPVALIEYKNENANKLSADSPQAKVIRNLANAAGIPAFLVYYGTDLSWFCMLPLTKCDYLSEPVRLCEQHYVRWLYFIRQQPVEPGFLDGFRTRADCRVCQKKASND